LLVLLVSWSHRLLRSVYVETVQVDSSKSQDSSIHQWYSVQNGMNISPTRLQVTINN